MNKEKNKRDDFTEKTKKLLADKVSYFCSNPSCRVLTKGSKFESVKSIGVGVAAHITAASQGGARYNAKLSHEERKHYSNGIWLCHTCSTLIDVDDGKYSVALLNDWKKKAEEYSNNSVGKKFYDSEYVEREATKRTIEYIIGDEAETFIGFPSKVIKFHNAQLEKLDSRFKIKTDIIDGVVHSRIEAASDAVKISLNASEQKYNDELKSKMRLLGVNGQDFEISADKINFTGSPLLENILDEGAKLTVLPMKEKIDCELFCHNQSKTVSICSFNGKIWGGSKQTTIDAMAFNKFLRFKAVFGENILITYSINTGAWIGKDIQRLPYFPKLKKTVPILKNNGGLFVEITNKNFDTIPVGKTLEHDDVEFIEQFMSLISYVDMARNIADKLNLNLDYHNFKASAEDLDAMREVCSLFEQPLVAKASQIASDARISICVNDDFDDTNSLIGKDNVFIRIDEPLNLREILNQSIPTIYIRHEFNGVKVNSDVALCAGGEVELILELGDNGEYIKSVVMNKEE